MAKMTGFQLARRIKDLQPDVHVILISAFEINKTEFDKVMPHKHIDSFLAKPFPISALIGAIKTLDQT
jgi:YesN/AraC family two-component response regulator